MRCKLFEVPAADVRAGILPALLRNSTLAIFLNLALLAWGGTLYAQDDDPKADGTISGTVFLPGNGGPAAQVPVTLKSHEAGIFRSVLTDYDGRFEIRGLTPSNYEITIEEQGYETFRGTAQLDGPSLSLELRLIAVPPPPKGDPYTVSVRELAIPRKAQDEYRKGLERLERKDQTGSLGHFTKAAQLFSGYYEAFYHQGLVQANLGHLDVAMQAFQRSIDLSGGRYAKAEFGAGYILYLQAKAREAEPIIRRGLELDPNSADGYVILGLTLLQLNRTDEAEKSAREALHRNPRMANAYLVLADSCARREDYEEQVHDLDSYLKLAPTGPISKHVHEIREVALKILNKLRLQKSTPQ